MALACWAQQHIVVAEIGVRQPEITPRSAPDSASLDEHHTRDVGALVKSTAVKRGAQREEEEDGGGGAGPAAASVRSFTARLLPDGNKTLHEGLPAVKLLARSAKK